MAAGLKFLFTFLYLTVEICHEVKTESNEKLLTLDFSSVNVKDLIITFSHSLDEFESDDKKKKNTGYIIILDNPKLKKLELSSFGGDPTIKNNPNLVINILAQKKSKNRKVLKKDSKEVDYHNNTIFVNSLIVHAVVLTTIVFYFYGLTVLDEMFLGLLPPLSNYHEDGEYKDLNLGLKLENIRRGGGKDAFNKEDTLEEGSFSPATINDTVEERTAREPNGAKGKTKETTEKRKMKKEKKKRQKMKSGKRRDDAKSRSEKAVRRRSVEKKRAKATKVEKQEKTIEKENMQPTQWEQEDTAKGEEKSEKKSVQEKGKQAKLEGNMITKENEEKTTKQADKKLEEQKKEENKSNSGPGAEQNTDQLRAALHAYLTEELKTLYKEQDMLEDKSSMVKGYIRSTISRMSDLASGRPLSPTDLMLPNQWPARILPSSLEDIGLRVTRAKILMDGSFGYFGFINTSEEHSFHISSIDSTVSLLLLPDEVSFLQFKSSSLKKKQDKGIDCLVKWRDEDGKMNQVITTLEIETVKEVVRVKHYPDGAVDIEAKTDGVWIEAHRFSPFLNIPPVYRMRKGTANVTYDGERGSDIVCYVSGCGLFPGWRAAIKDDE